MIIEEVFDEQYTPPLPRRLKGHMKGSTKKGNKKRGLRARMPGLLDEEVAADEDDEEDACLSAAVDLLQRLMLCHSRNNQSWWVKLGGRRRPFKSV
jgi:hypothetical protein